MKKRHEDGKEFMEMENEISRRKFLTVSTGAVLALVCVGCGVKVDQTTKVVDADSTMVPTSQSGPTDSAPVNTVVSPDVEPTTIPTSIPTPVPTQAPVAVSSRCPRGLINDPYPGRCRHYIDQNGNGFCDLSEVG